MEPYGKRGLWISVIFMVVTVTFLTMLRVHFVRQTEAGEKHITITVTDAEGASKRYPVDTDAEYLKEAAESVLTLDGEETANGYTVYSINGVTADYRTEHVYWAIYVNGDYGNYAIDRQPIADGDAYAFVYEQD